MQFLSTRNIDTALQWLKLLEQKWYRDDYRRLAETLRSLAGDGWLTYRERLLPAMPAREAVGSVLIFKPDEIGDAIHSLPAIANLKEYYAGAEFSLICQKSTQGVFERTELFAEISAVEVKKWLIRFPYFSVPAALSRFSPERFDLSVFLRTYPAYFGHYLKIPSRYQLHPLDPRMTSRSPLQAPVSLWGDQRRHQARQMLEIVSLLTGNREAEIVYPRFHWREEDQQAVHLAFGAEVPDSFVVVHPFARFETRRYPYWPEILRWLEQTYDCAIVIIGGKEDAPDCESFRRYHQVQGKLSMTQSGYLLSQAKAFLGNESGPAHWAGALGVPTVTFFGGHSLPAEWAPRGKTLLLNHEVSCAPCHRRACPGYGVKCLTELKPETLYRRLADFLADALPRHGVP